MIDNDWGLTTYPLIPGTEIVGEITAVGSKVKLYQVGQRVGLGWQLNSCGACQASIRGQE